MKLVIITSFLFVAFSVAHAEGQVFDGYMWENTPFDLKGLIVAGYVSGYKNGTMAGILYGIGNVINITSNVGEKVEERQTAKDFSTCTKIIKKSEESLIKSSLILTHVFEDSREPKYYVNEVDSFLKTYPLCRRKEVFSMLLPQLAIVWFPIGEKTLTYKDIGEECSNTN